MCGADDRTALSMARRRRYRLWPAKRSIFQLIRRHADRRVAATGSASQAAASKAR
jgi:hypothetical protein